MDELRILIADDHELIRRGVRDLLSVRDNWHVVGEACDGDDAVRQAESLRPDVAILDFSMPRMNGPEASVGIAEKSPGTAVVVLTMHDSDEVIQAVLRCGARGLVLKSDADRTLLGAVEAVAENRHFFTKRVSEQVLGGYLAGTTAGTAAVHSKRKSDAPCLTGREGEVMRLLADGLTNKEAAQLLKISTRTVESHRININRKLGFGSIVDLVRYAIRNGIVSHN
jgi:DNA-binding NarL/FixJ family response regulator